MNFEPKGPVSLKNNTVAVAPASEEQELNSAATVAEPGKVDHPDLNALLAALEHDRIANLAYFCWQQRGCPEGSPEEDWFLAEKQIREGQ